MNNQYTQAINFLKKEYPFAKNVLIINGNSNSSNLTELLILDESFVDYSFCYKKHDGILFEIWFITFPEFKNRIYNSHNITFLNKIIEGTVLYDESNVFYSTIKYLQYLKEKRIKEFIKPNNKKLRFKLTYLLDSFKLQESKIKQHLIVIDILHNIYSSLSSQQGLPNEDFKFKLDDTFPKELTNHFHTSILNYFNKKDSKSIIGFCNDFLKTIGGELRYYPSNIDNVIFNDSIELIIPYIGELSNIIKNYILPFVKEIKDFTKDIKFHFRSVNVADLRQLRITITSEESKLKDEILPFIKSKFLLQSESNIEVLYTKSMLYPDCPELNNISESIFESICHEIIRMYTEGVSLNENNSITYAIYLFLTTGVILFEKKEFADFSNHLYELNQMNVINYNKIFSSHHLENEKEKIEFEFEELLSENINTINSNYKHFLANWDNVEEDNNLYNSMLNLKKVKIILNSYNKEEFNSILFEIGFIKNDLSVNDKLKWAFATKFLNYLNDIFSLSDYYKCYIPYLVKNIINNEI